MNMFVCTGNKELAAATRWDEVIHAALSNVFVRVLLFCPFVSFCIDNAFDSQAFNAGVKDIEFWLGEVEQQLSSDEYGKDLLSVQVSSARRSGRAPIHGPRNGPRNGPNGAATESSPSYLTLHVPPFHRKSSLSLQPTRPLRTPPLFGTLRIS